MHVTSIIIICYLLTKTWFAAWYIFDLCTSRPVQVWYTWQICKHWYNSYFFTHYTINVWHEVCFMCLVFLPYADWQSPTIASSIKHGHCGYVYSRMACNCEFSNTKSVIIANFWNVSSKNLLLVIIVALMMYSICIQNGLACTLV